MVAAYGAVVGLSVDQRPEIPLVGGEIRLEEPLVGGDPRLVPVPPAQLEQEVDDGLLEAGAQHPGRGAGSDGEGGTSLVTTAPAPITAPSPMVTPGRMITLSPSHTALPTTTSPL